MKLMMTGFSSWMRMQKPTNESVKAVDTGITVIGTVLLAVTYMLIRG